MVCIAVHGVCKFLLMLSIHRIKRIYEQVADLMFFFQKEAHLRNKLRVDGKVFLRRIRETGQILPIFIKLV